MHDGMRRAGAFAAIECGAAHRARESDFAHRLGLRSELVITAHEEYALGVDHLRYLGR